jgi:hypothetical protein
MQVHFDTYREIESYISESGRSIPQFVVDVTVRDERRTVRASSVFNDRITVHGLAVRFSSGSKVWPGSAIYWIKSGNVNHIRPNIDKSGNFILVGYAEDFDGKAVRSQHNAVA